MKRKKHMQREYMPRLDEIISRKFDIPIEQLSNIPTVEIKNDSEVWVCGCIGIEKYESNIIVLKMKKCPLSIIGKGLYMHTFTEMRLCIYGRISAVMWGVGEKSDLYNIISHMESK